MKNITCGHLLSVSLIRKRLGEMGVNIHDMTLFIAANVIKILAFWGKADVCWPNSSEIM